MTKKWALITGASRGLGFEIAKNLYQSGWNIYLLSSSVTALEKARALLISLKKPKEDQVIKLLPIDLSQGDQWESIIKSRVNDVDVLVNNAAIQGPIGPVLENDWSFWQKTIQVNLLAPIRLCRLCLPLMIQKRQGKIINISGGGATGPRPYFSAYAVSKAGLVRFSETLAEEVKPYSIDVNCIAPGVMNSPLLAEVLQAGIEKAGEKEYNIAQAQQSKTGDVAVRAAELCAYLASSQSDGITGKLMSAVWDPWETLADHKEELKTTDIYTLRRIVPKDRGKNWGER